MLKWTIYSLSDPRVGEVRYIGWTSNLDRRKREHFCPQLRERTHKANWIRVLKAEGLTPICDVLEEGVGAGYATAECRWIALYRTRSPNLTNITNGGDGATGHIKSVRTRELSSLALKGKRRPREVIDKWLATKRLKAPSQKQLDAVRAMSASNIGRKQPRSAIEFRAMRRKGKSWGKHSDSIRMAISERFKGVPKSPEHRANISASRVDMKPSAESVRKMRKTKRKKREAICNVLCSGAQMNEN